jgi:type III pantothenate kinase
MILLLDVGNTRLKWGWLAEGAPSARGAILHRGREATEWLAELPAADPAPERILAANVAGPGVAHAIGEWSLASFGRRAEFPLATRAAGGVTNAYTHPEALGVDRWLGMIGAWQRAHAPLACIVAGTAVTIDAVDGSGRHLGGWILPGQPLMAEALYQGTADIARGAAREAAALAGDFGINTAGAIEAGGWQMLAAGAARAVHVLARTCQCSPAVFISGGDAREIASRLEMPATMAADLVLEGLAVLARNA